MRNEAILLLRGGYFREFALKTLFRKQTEIITIDKPFSKELAFADYPYIIDDIWDPAKMFELGLEIYEKRKYTGVFAFCDSSIVALGMLSDYLGLNYFSEKTARIVADKLEVRKHLKKIGADDICFFEIDSLESIESAAEKLTYPFVLKPTDRSAGKGVIVVNTPAELEKAYEYVAKTRKNGRLVAEEFIRGDEYCVEVIVVDSEVFVPAISKKYVTYAKYCIELIDITPAPIDKELKMRIENYIKETISEFGIINSVLHIEIKVDDKDCIRIIEINPRPAGGNLIEAIYHLKGLNIYDYAFDLALKRPIDKERLKESIALPFNKYALFNSFINPPKSGNIKKVKGIDLIAKELSNDYERIMLFFDKGDYLPEPKTNEHARGFIYLIDEDVEELLRRSERIESLVDFEVE